MVIAILALVIGLAAAPATTPPASAATAVGPVAQAAGKFTGYIDFHAQCKRQGQFGASFWNYWNPYTWYCYSLSIPVGISIGGGLDLNAACAAQYPTNRGWPRSWAKLVAGNNVNGWRCVNY
ncbi:hypothetical protein NS183_13240 [Microbacterium testaceum]|nr:hypothetical protein NS183_13240 [Microbacterium testaceum]